MRILLHYGGFDLRYDLSVPFSQSLPWADAARIAGTTPWTFGAYRWVRLLKHDSFRDYRATGTVQAILPFDTVRPFRRGGYHPPALSTPSAVSFDTSWAHIVRPQSSADHHAIVHRPKNKKPPPGGTLPTGRIIPENPPH